ncbi:MAG: hypothetical protein QGI89_05610, partial [Candidatus Woesearchaeota archaeon]|nr:hypothetical protein [Candidatus Woesearchaeota archaeon]
QNFLNHLFHPIIFLGKQIGILIPFFLMVVLLASKFKTKFNFKDKKLLFLLTINIVPIILMFLTSMLMGVKIRTMWMTPFYLFFGVLIIYIFQSQINLSKLKSFTLVFLIIFYLIRKEKQKIFSILFLIDFLSAKLFTLNTTLFISDKLVDFSVTSGLNILSYKFILFMI